MATNVSLLAITSFIIAFTHTILGPDHYLPFIVLSKARGWTLKKTTWITFLCGLGHILSSIVLGFIGLALGIAVFQLEVIEAFRGDIAAWLLIIFGFTYFIWGLRNMLKNKRHKHFHFHGDGTFHTHDHAHYREHAHVHAMNSKQITSWVLSLIFVFGPCEPLIPLLMYPAAENNLFAVIVVTLIFGVTTIATMLAIVITSYYGLSNLSFFKLEKYVHVIAGSTIFLCGTAIKFLGL